MPLLAGKLYDPTSAVSKVTSSLIAMTALDTTNLRLTFTAPANGIVQVRIACTVHGATTYPGIVLGVLESTTVRGRMRPIGALKTTALATAMLSQEAVFLVTGLTPGNSYTFDAAYGVETAIASTAIKYGGPNNTTANDAFGGIAFEIYSVPNLLAGKLYDPASSVVVTSSPAGVLTALDTTNLRLTFTAPASGIVMVRLACCVEGQTTYTTYLLGVLESTTVRGRMAPLGGLIGPAGTAVSAVQEACFLVTGLTPGNSYTFDAAYAIETAVLNSAIKYGGGNTGGGAPDTWGGFAYEIWDVTT